MICPKCNHILPDDSTFCQFCGELIEKAADQKMVEIASPEAEASPSQKDRKKPVAIILAIALLLSVIANAAQLYYSSMRAEEIDGLNQNIAAKAEEVAELKQEISSKNNKISSLQAEYNNYKTLCNFIKNETPGYGSNLFYVSDGLIVLNQHASKEITLTTLYYGYVTISTKASGNSATISFNEDSWYGSSTTLTVYGRSKGITTVTFSTNVDTTTFKVMVVVI